MALALRGVTSCCYLIITPCCDRCRVGLLWFMSSVVAASNAELRHSVILSVPPAVSHLFLLTLKIFNRRTVVTCVVLWCCDLFVQNLKIHQSVHDFKLWITLERLWRWWPLQTRRYVILLTYHCPPAISFISVDFENFQSSHGCHLGSALMLWFICVKFENPPNGALQITQHDSDSRYYRYAASGFCWQRQRQRQRRALPSWCLHHRFNAVLNSWVYI